MPTIRCLKPPVLNRKDHVGLWNKGDTAFLTEGSDETMTFKDCVAD